MAITNDYHGITYNPRWKSNCKKGIHRLDEVGSDKSGDHFLVCDDCQLVINIKDIDDQYVEDKDKNLKPIGGR